MKLNNEALLKEKVEQYKKGEISMDEMAIVLADEMQEEAKLIIAEINKKPETTKGRYQEYLQWILGFEGLYREAIIKALAKNGADTEGLAGALMIIKGE